MQRRAGVCYDLGHRALAGAALRPGPAIRDYLRAPTGFLQSKSMARTQEEDDGGGSAHCPASWADEKIKPGRRSRSRTATPERGSSPARTAMHDYLRAPTGFLQPKSMGTGKSSQDNWLRTIAQTHWGLTFNECGPSAAGGGRQNRTLSLAPGEGTRCRPQTGRKAESANENRCLL